MNELIARKFLEEMGGQELWPAMHNSAPLINAGGWTHKRYFSRFYKDDEPFPAFVSIVDGEGTLHISLGKAKRLAKEIFSAHLEDVQLIPQLQSQWETWRKEIDNLYERMNDSYFGTTSQDVIRQDLERLRDVIWGYNASAFFSTGFDREIGNEVLSDRSLEFPDEAWVRGLQSPVASFEKRHGWEVAQLMNGGVSRDDLDAACQYFFARYDMVPHRGMVAGLLEEQYASYLKEDGLSVARAEQVTLAGAIREYDDWIGTLTSEQQHIARFFRFAILARDERKDSLLKVTTIAFRAANVFLEKNGMQSDLDKYLLFDEIVEGAVYVKQHEEEIERRPFGFDVFCPYDGETLVQYGATKENRQLIDAAYGEQNGVGISDTEIRGSIGSKGFARGNVRVVRHLATESVGFEAGDILVTGMTRPEYVPLMKRAGAVITDEGGITCHAAIVSRELGIPCIIGTKIATQVLKDGDLVEVDAENGVVRILEGYKK